MSHTAQNLETALRHARAGLRVFPGKVFRRFKGWTKKPAILEWQERATTDEAQLRAWWAQFPEALPCIELGRSGLVVIDADRHDGGTDGVAAFHQLAKDIGVVEPHPVTLSATGSGQHHFFRQPEGAQLGNSAGGLPYGIDIRGAGGLVVAPGAIRCDGAAYKPMEGAPTLAEAYAADTIPSLPDEIVDQVTHGHRAEDGRGNAGRRVYREYTGPVDVAYEMANLRPGRINETQCRVVGKLMTDGKPYTEINEFWSDGVMEWASHPDRADKCRDWTREAEAALTNEVIGCFAHSRSKKLEYPLPAPAWVDDSLLEAWTKVAEEGNKPEVFYSKRTGYHIRKHWTRKGNGADTHQEETPRTDGAGADTRKDAPREEARQADPPPGGRRRAQMLTSASFIAGFIPPDYLIDGVIQVRFLYSLTGPTGSGKTGILLLLAAHIALGRPLCGREVKQGHVLILAGENPDDVRMRWIAMAEHLEFDPETIPVHFLPGVFPLDDIKRVVAAEAAKIKCEFVLIIVDTSAAYFAGNDENSNVQLGNHARFLRTLVEMPGGPCTLVSNHPTKNADMDNLLPRGGGAYLNEVDGNLICKKAGGEGISEVHWHGKFRGTDFNPLTFELKPGITCDKLVDSRGRLIPTVMAAPIDEHEHRVKRASSLRQEDDILIALNTDEDSKSLAEVAQLCGWITKQGEPDRSKAQRGMNRLRDARLVKTERDGWTLTEAGKKAASKAESRRERTVGV
jgi:hypothetical protein